MRTTRLVSISESSLPPLDLDGLVARSQRIGADPSLVVHGGGNTSSKGSERDWRDRRRPVLRVKGSGTDLATIDAAGFPGLYLDELEAIRGRDAMSDEEMVAYLAHCMREPGGRAPSIETLLHAWLPAPHVDHTHADAICALSNHPGGAQAIADALGQDVAIVPYLRPGFELSKRVAALADAEAVVLAHHGLVTWGETHAQSLDRTLALDGRARAFLDRNGAPAAPTPRPDLGERDTLRLLGALRDALSADGRPVVLHLDRGQRALADRSDARIVAVAGRSTPDHILRIGPWSLVVDAADDVPAAIARYAADYRAYHERHARRLPPGLPIHDPLPRVVLVPGLGCVTAGATPHAAKVCADLARHSHTVTARVLDVFGTVSWLDEAEIFDFDYWPLELRKLAHAAAPPRLQGRIVALDLGDGSDAGPLAVRLAAEGAVVASSVTAALLDHGGVDAIVATPRRLQVQLDAATLLDGAAASPAVVVIGAYGDETAASAARLNVVAGGPSDAATAEAVAFLVSAGAEATSGSTIDVSSRSTSR